MVARPLTCRQILAGLLAGQDGLTIAELAANLGWRRASVRAEISRLRARGAAIYRSERRPYRYRLAAPVRPASTCHRDGQGDTGPAGLPRNDPAGDLAGTLKSLCLID